MPVPKEAYLVPLVLAFCQVPAGSDEEYHVARALVAAIARLNVPVDELDALHRKCLHAVRLLETGATPAGPVH